jgi:ferredoxin
MFSYNKNAGGYNLETPPPDEKKQLVFGIRPCDARALTILDMTFKDNYQDPYYLNRRQNTMFIGLSCSDPYDSCFCTSLGGSPSDSQDVDIMLSATGDGFLVESITAAGEELMNRTKSLQAATENDRAEAEGNRQAARQKVTRNIEIKDTGEKLRQCFDDEGFWQQVAAKCISCGICTLLCPTCYCFDINDEVTDKGGARFRSPDSCAFAVYTRMPVENPRSEKWKRVRNRICHKYQVYPLLFDTIACTGCGRCIRLCPVNWDITQTLKGLPAAGVKDAG